LGAVYEVWQNRDGITLIPDIKLFKPWSWG